MSRMVSLFMLLAIIAVISILFYRVMIGFLLPLFLAVLLAVIFRPIHRWVLRKCNQREFVAACLTTAAILLIVLAPLGLVFGVAIQEGFQLIGNKTFGDVVRQGERFREAFGLQRPFDEQLTRLDRRMRELPPALPPRGSMLPEPLLREALAAAVDLKQAIQATQQRLQQNPDVVEETPEGRAAQRLLELQQELEALRADAAGPGDDFGVQNLQGPHAPARDSIQALGGLNQVLETMQMAVQFADQDELRPARAAEMRENYHQLHEQYDTFRVRLLGGPILAQLIDVANPSQAEMTAVLLRSKAWLNLGTWLPSITGQATAWVGSLLLGLAIMTLGLFYFLKDGPAMIQTLMRLSPLDDRYERELLAEFETVSRAVILATLLSAVAQGLLAAIAYFLAGFNSVFFLTILTASLALVPFVGAAAVWLPACLWLAFVEERLLAAVLMFAYGVGVISMVDNIIKPFVLQDQSRLHPLFALLSVLGGVQALGPIGILVGPMVVAFLQALLNILNSELQEMEKEAVNRKSARSAPPPI